MRANRRPRTVGFIIGAIAVAFLLSFFSLVQTVRVSASGYDMAQLNDEYLQLETQRSRSSPTSTGWVASPPSAARRSPTA